MIARGIVMMAGGVAECVGNRFQVAELGVSKAGGFAGTARVGRILVSDKRLIFQTIVGIPSMSDSRIRPT